jgi:hypothetical protein
MVSEKEQGYGLFLQKKQESLLINEMIPQHRFKCMFWVPLLLFTFMATCNLLQNNPM